MKLSQQIALLVIPAIISTILIRWIIISGPELKMHINDYVFANYALYMGDWELDHVSFGFSLGAPLLIWTVLLKLFQKLSLLRLIIYKLSFYLLQMIALAILSLLFVDVLHSDSLLLPFSFLTIPHYWFWNLALIIASLSAFFILASILIIPWFKRHKTEPNTIDS